jgi:hypothetical protein
MFISTFWGISILFPIQEVRKNMFLYSYVILNFEQILIFVQLRVKKVDQSGLFTELYFTFH